MKKNSFFRRIFRKPAILFVTLYANHIYKEGVAAAKRRRLREGCTVYLAASSWRPDHLVTYTKPQFKREKKVYGVAARLLTMNTLRAGCYYHTPDRYGMNAMEEKEVKIRRKAFVKERLSLAGLI
jgi:hypothetical protein